MTRDYDGRPRQAGADSHTLHGRYNNYSVVGMREGVVIRVLYVDDQDNRNKAAVEYVVRDIGTQKEFRCVQLLPTSGQDDGDDTVLRAAGATNTKGQLTSYTAAKDTDGDHVHFMCVEGSIDVGVILGVKRHRQARYGAKRADGRRRLVRNAGTNVELHADGGFTITRDKDTTRLNIDKNGNIALEHKKGAKLIIDADGQVTLDAAAGQKVILQDGTLGVARLTDTVDESGALVAWDKALIAFYTQVIKNEGILASAFSTLGITPSTPPGPIPQTVGVISSASKKITGG